MLKFNLLIFLIISFFVVFAQPPGTLDSTFANNGVFSKDMSDPNFADRFQFPNKLFRQKNGSLFSVNYISPGGGSFNINITKILSNGKVDSTFGENGTSVLGGGTNMYMGIDNMFEDPMGNLFIVNSYYYVSNLGSNIGTSVFKLDKFGKVLVPFSFFTKPLILNYTLASIFTKDSKTMVSTPDGVYRVDNNGGLDKSFNCAIKNVIGISELVQENKYLLFSLNNQMLIVQKVNANGSLDNQFANYDFNVSVDLNTQIGIDHNFKNCISGFKQVNDSTLTFLVLSNYRKTFIFTLNTSSKTISAINEIPNINRFYNNIFYDYIIVNPSTFYFKNYYSGGWLYYNNKFDTPDISYGIYTGLCNDQDTVWTLKGRAPSRKIKIQKLIDGVPDSTFGTTSEAEIIPFFDQDIIAQTIKLPNAFLVNSNSSYSKYCKPYLLDFDGNVSFPFSSIYNLKRTKRLYLFQNGDDIIYLNDSISFKYNIVSNQFVEYNIPNKNNLNVLFDTQIGNGFQINAFKNNYVLVSIKNFIYAFNYITGELDLGFGVNGRISLDPLDVNTSNAIYDCIVNTTLDRLLVFGHQGNRYAFNLNGIPVTSFGVNGKIVDEGYRLISNNEENPILIKNLNDSTHVLKKIDAFGNDLASAGSNITNPNKGVPFIDLRHYQTYSPIPTKLMEKQADGKYLLTVSKNAIYPLGSTLVYRLNSDLTKDSSFGNNGIIELKGMNTNITIVLDKAFLFIANPFVFNSLTLDNNVVYKIWLGPNILNVKDIPFEEGNFMFPNPTLGILKVNTDNKTADVYSSLGVKIITKNIVDNQVDISELNKGIYLIKIAQQTFKVVKE